MNKALNAQLGDILKGLRSKRGYTVREVAKRIKKAPATVSDHELGKISIPLEVFLEYCKMYGVDPSDILSQLNYKQI